MAPTIDVGGWVAPAMELVYERGTAAFRGQWPGLEPKLELSELRTGQGDWDHPWLELRRASAGAPRHDAWTAPPPSVGSPPPAAGILHNRPAARVAALDAAGVDLQLISPGPTIDACLELPSTLSAGVLGAYNQYAFDYCEPFPDRLGAVLQVHGGEPRWSAHEIATMGQQPSVRAITICLPVRIAPDADQFDQLWAAVEASGMPLLQRAGFSAQVWSAARLLTYLREGGVLNRFPGLRFGFFGEARLGSASSLTPELDRLVAADPSLGDRVFTTATAAQFASGARSSASSLWASDFPLSGDLTVQVRQARASAGDEILSAAPARFLGIR
jgi:hypothetical protein